jgi:hypothetical protein
MIRSTGTPSRSAIHSRNGEMPSVREYCSAGTPGRASTRAVASVSSRAGSSCGSGMPPSSSMASTLRSRRVASPKPFGAVNPVIRAGRRVDAAATSVVRVMGIGSFSG